jgi:O-methyltransferase involved in polyketide biosynthesis
VDFGEPVFFSWLGVTMYLPERTVMATLAGMASIAAPGSQVIFDYVVPLRQLPLLRRVLLRLMMHRLARIGEPWQAFFDPATLVASLERIGFAPVVDLGPVELNALYFDSREDGLEVGGSGHVMSAHLGRQGIAVGRSAQ